MLNSRCWVKGTANLSLDSGLKDCTRSIELSENPANALDSRAMIYFRMGRFDDALADLEAALNHDPAQAASLYLRGIVLKRQGKSGDADLAAARLISPRIDEDYARYGIKP
jgi:tetratricopeptide (TPR) repeat protein